MQYSISVRCETMYCISSLEHQADSWIGLKLFSMPSLTLGAHAQRGLRYLVCHSVCLSVCLSVCYHVFCHYAQHGGQKAIPTGSVPHWLDFKKGDFCKSTAFKSYGVKTKRTSQYANEHGSDSACFEHGGGSRSNMKGEYVVLVCQKHYLPT